MTTTSKKAKIQAVKNSVQGVTTASELQVSNDVKAVAEQATEQGRKAKTASSEQAVGTERAVPVKAAAALPPKSKTSQKVFDLKGENAATSNLAEPNFRVASEFRRAAQEKRDWLRAISADFQAQRDIMQLMGADYIPTINEMLHAYYAKQNNITELNTFDQWKEKGYQVRKGEKAYLFWGKPRAKQVKPTEPTEQEEEPTEQAEQTTAKKDDYYPICYLFDISQCHKAAI